MADQHQNNLTPEESGLLRERFVGRQPILDPRQQLIGYELLFRSGEVNHAGPIDGNLATCDVFDCMMNVMGLETLAGGHQAFVNITRDTLLERRYEVLPTEGVVLELLEDVQPDLEVIDACRGLKRAGYTLALDDVVCAGDVDKLLDLADIVKVDFMLTTPQQRREVLQASTAAGCKCLAEKVEDKDEFSQARDLGFDYFQGYFFQKPDILKQKELKPAAEQGLRLLAAVSKEVIDFAEIEQIMKGDVGLSTRFLKYLNSSHFGFRNQIASIRHAATLLGERAMRQWVAMLSMQTLSSNSTPQLMVSALVRAHMCESLAKGLGLGHRQMDLYMLGLLSLLDTMLSSPLEMIIDRLPVADDVREALVDHSGPLLGIHRAVSAFEQNQLPLALQITSEYGIDAQQLCFAYTDATRWANEVFGTPRQVA